MIPLFQRDNYLRQPAPVGSNRARVSYGQEGTMIRDIARVLLLGSDSDTAPLVPPLAASAEVSRVNRVPEAFRLLESGAYDALFCPWEAAGMNWRNVVEEMRKRLLNIPVIVFCRCCGEREWVEALRAGAFDLLVPPYNRCQLRALLEQILTSRLQAGCAV